MAELYPTDARPTAQSALFDLDRAVGGFALVVIALIAAPHGFGFALVLLPMIYVLAFATMFLLPDRKRAELASQGYVQLDHNRPGSLPPVHQHPGSGQRQAPRYGGRAHCPREPHCAV